MICNFYRVSIWAYNAPIFVHWLYNNLAWWWVVTIPNINTASGMLWVLAGVWLYYWGNFLIIFVVDVFIYIINRRLFIKIERLSIMVGVMWCWLHLLEHSFRLVLSVVVGQIFWRSWRYLGSKVLDIAPFWVFDRSCLKVIQCGFILDWVMITSLV
jgi:hypothetical protein